jgi:tetratricopeptide (TPR) repeat protein
MLDRLDRSDPAGEHFDLLLNPFVLLRVGLEADAREINRGYEDAAEAGAATTDILQRARQTLLTPRLRIDAELGAFFDCPAALSAQVLDLLAGSDSKRLNELIAQLSALAQSNVRAHLASRRPASVPELMALLRAQAATAPTEIQSTIEATRQKARCGQIEPDGVAQGLDRLHRRQCAAAIERLVERPGYAAQVASFVRAALADPALSRKLELHVGAYRGAALPELSRRRVQVTAACQATRENCKDPAAGQRVLDALRHWNEIAVPLEIFEGHLDRDEPYAREVYQEAHALVLWLWERKDYDIALAITLGCVDTFAAMPRALTEMREDAAKLNSNIANGSLREGLLDRAMESCERAIALDPRHDMAYNNRGVTYERRGEYDRAIADYSEAIRLNPNFALAYSNRAWIHYEKKSYDAAAADYSQAIRINPTDAELCRKRGDVFYDKKDYAAAISDYTEALRISPANPNIHRGRGNAFYFRKNYDAAIVDYSETIRLDPSDLYAYRNRGTSYYYKENYDAAIADYSQVIKANPDDVIALHDRGLSYKAKQDFDRAIADYTAAIRIKPDYASAYFGRGLSYDNKKEYDRAIADYTAAIRIDPTDSAAYNNRGLCRDNKRDYDLAIADYTEAIRLKPDYAAAYNNRGVAYEGKKDYARAIADYDQALRIDPHYARPRNNRTDAYAALRKKRVGSRRKWKALFWVALAGLLLFFLLRH